MDVHSLAPSAPASFSHPLTTTATTLRQPQRPAGQHDLLLLLSHMRSYSSLLAHLLGQSAEIEGYGETLLRYSTRLDLWRLRHRIRQATGQPLRGRWLLDKQLHNHLHTPDRWMPAGRVRALIFIRQPEATLRSMLHLARSKAEFDPADSPQRVCDYYVSRLHRLRQDGERLGHAALYHDAETLVDQPQQLLQGLTHWLGLPQPLSTEYAVGRRTGEVGFGDPLPNIRAGRVLPASASTTAQADGLPALSPAILAEAEAAYSRCRAALRASCSVIG